MSNTGQEDSIEQCSKKESQNNSNKKSQSGASLLRGRIIILGGEVLVILGIGFAFFYFCYLVKGIINPIVLLVILVASLIPFWKFLWSKILLVLLMLLFSLWLIAKAGHLIAPFIIGAILGYLFDPLIIRLSKKIPRLLSVLLIFIPLLALACIFLLFVLPRAIEETKVFLQGVPLYTQNITNSIINLSVYVTNWLNSNVPGDAQFDLTTNNEAIINFMNNFLFGADGIFKDVYLYLSDIRVTNITKIFSVVFSYFVILPFVTFYFMLDFSNIKKSILKLIPLRWQDGTEDVLSKSNNLINNYIRGMGLLAVIFFILSYFLLSITNTRYPLALGLLRGILNFIPFIGPFVAFFIALVVALATDAVWWHGAVKAILIYGSIQILDSGFLGPKILGQMVRIHPIAIMFASIIGGVLFGFIGVLIAIPSIAIIILLMHQFYTVYLKSKFYTNKKGASKSV